jgi:hypothetical protein
LINDIKKCGKENCLSNNIIDLLYKWFYLTKLFTFFFIITLFKIYI